MTKSESRPRSIGRRTFLYTTAGATLAMPFLSSLSPTRMRAQDMTAPRRFVAIQSYSGQIARQWYPTRAPAGYRLRDAVFSDAAKQDGTTYLHGRVAGTPYGHAPLTDFAGGVSAVLGTDLDPYLGKMNLLRGVDFLAGTSHTEGGYFGNYAACTNSNVYDVVPAVPTIDQVMAHSTRFYESAPLLRTMHVGTGSNTTFSYTNYGMPGGAVEAAYCTLNPREAWQEAFGAFMSPDMPVENPNRSLLNAIYEDYRRLGRSSRLSMDDRQLLERHVAFLADIERRISGMTGVACTVPGMPRDIENGYPWRDVSSIEDLEETVASLVDVCVAALRCDVTRVVTFKVQKAITNASGTPRASYHESGDVAGDWHQFAHSVGDGYSENNVLAIHQWTASRVFRRFLEGLDSAPDVGGSTVLDNSLVVWGNELGYSHYTTDVQTLTAGSAGGRLRTGQYIDYIDWDQDYANPIENWGVLSPGVPHNRWLVTMLQAMGLSPADYESTPGAGYGQSAVIDAPWAWPGHANMGAIAMPLPGLMV